jgi:aspartate aminotransferase
VTVELSTFSKSLAAEAAFTVLAIAKQLQAAGKDVVELEIGDSPFDTPHLVKTAGIKAIEQNQSHYCPSPGLPEFRDAAARMVRDEFGIPAERENVVVTPGAKVLEQFFCEAFLNPGDGVLVFSPYFPTYVPNIVRRGGRPVFAPLRQTNDFRPDIDDVERFLADDPSPKAIFLNSPHNPTGGVATEEDLRSIADLIRGEQIAVFSDEPYCHMVWRGQHKSLMAQQGMLDQGVAAYTFSKSYSMGGWRLGFAVTSPTTAESLGTMINTTLSCTPPIVQFAGKAALEMDRSERDAVMEKFSEKVSRLTQGLNRIDGFHTLEPRATFYVFSDVSSVCDRLGITSHGLALYLLEGADNQFGVACLGGECFGDAGAGFLRFSCAASDERLQQALDFIPTALSRESRVKAFLELHPEFRLDAPYAAGGEQ